MKVYFQLYETMYNDNKHFNYTLFRIIISKHFNYTLFRIIISKHFNYTLFRIMRSTLSCIVEMFVVIIYCLV